MGLCWVLAILMLGFAVQNPGASTQSTTTTGSLNPTYNYNLQCGNECTTTVEKLNTNDSPLNAASLVR